MDYTIAAARLASGAVSVRPTPDGSGFKTRRLLGRQFELAGASLARLRDVTGTCCNL